MTRKLKVRKSAKKRFKVTKTGKVLFDHQFHSHLLGKKSKARKRRQKETGVLPEMFAKKIKRLLAV